MNPMDLKCASWNVRGLESLDRKYIVKIFLNMNRNMDVFLLQEVKEI